jgi:hypothetical protein
VLEIDVLRAEHLPPLDFTKLGIDGYVKASYAGVTVKSKTVSGSEDDR